MKTIKELAEELETTREDIKKLEALKGEPQAIKMCIYLTNTPSPFFATEFKRFTKNIVQQVLDLARKDEEAIIDEMDDILHPMLSNTANPYSK